MRDLKNLFENDGTAKLGDLVKVSVNDPNADFWVVRRGTKESVGKPTEEFNPENYGITVTSDQLLPKYLFYAFMNLHNQGYFIPLAKGTLRLVNIRADDIRNIRIG